MGLNISKAGEYTLGWRMLLMVLLFVSGPYMLGCSDESSQGGAADGTSSPLLVTSLTQSVEVYRDEWGIPHIYAQNRGDMLFMQGYEMARDRIFHMDNFRRYIYGTRAEVYGRAYLSDDITKRTIGFRRLAEANLAWFGKEHKDIVDEIQSFCNGVNAYIEDMMAGRNGAIRPVEFDRIEQNYWPAQWQPVDVFAIAKAEIFSQSFLGEMEMLIYMARFLLGPKFKDFVRYQPLKLTYILEPFPTQDFGLTSEVSDPGRDISCMAEQSLDEATRRKVAEGLLMLARRLAQAFGKPLGSMSQGSNSWVVDGSLTAGGTPILCNDPHMNIDTPSTMYATHIVDLSQDEIGVVGNIPPGTPMVLIGHTASVAWGITNAFGDVTDLYHETLSSDHRSVLFDGNWVPMDFIEETILVRPDGGSVSDAVEEKHVVRWVPHHGPILIDLLPEEIASLLEFLGFVYSARWPGFAENTADVLTIARLLEAYTMDEAIEALRYFNSGAMNWVLADSSGNIGYVGAGPFPERADPVNQYPPISPLPGDGSHEWQGFLDFSLNPRSINPPKGYIVTANNTISDQTLDNDPFNDDQYWGHFFDLGTRAWRITERIEALKAQGPIKLTDCVKLQTDNYSVLAQEYLPYLFANRDVICADPGSDSCQALNMLSSWDMNLDVDSPEASLFSAWYTHLIYNTISDDIPSFLLAQASPYLAQIAGRDIAAWLAGRGPGICVNYFDNTKTRHKVETANDQMVLSLEQAVSQLAAFFGPERPMESWRWGEVHQKKFDHVAWDDMSQGYFENDGGLDTVDPAEYDLVHSDGSIHSLPYHQGEGPVFRFCVDMKQGEWETYNVLAGGESGHWGDEHYADQLPFWLDNETIRFWCLREDVEKHAVSHLTYPKGFPTSGWPVE